jgi:hypothetical protein
MTILETFLWGLGGSLGVEIVSLAQHMGGGQPNLPKRYTIFSFYVVRILLAIVAGGLAVAYQIDKPLLAANIGAATPLILQALSQGFSGGGSPGLEKQAPRTVKRVK